MSDSKIFQEFEQSFLGRDLEVEVKGCGKQELAALFVEVFRDHQPVLEGGCGSGKWLHFLKREGIASVGLDWSEPLQAVSRAYDTSVQFDTGDLRDLPYTDETFGGVMALGSIEHVIEGPRKILQELYRVLRKGGAGIITVPYYSPVARVTQGCCGEPARQLARSGFFRKLTGKPSLKPGNPVSYRELVVQRYRKDIYMELDFDGYFFEYRFRQDQLREELERAGFVVEKLYPYAGEFGLYLQLSNVLKLGRLVATFDRKAEVIHFTPLGKLLVKLLPAQQSGHMLCAVVRKK